MELFPTKNIKKSEILEYLNPDLNCTTSTTETVPMIRTKSTIAAMAPPPNPESKK